MNDKEEGPILGQADGRIPLLVPIGGVFHAKEGIEEDLARNFKAHTMFVLIAGSLFRIPHKALSEMEKVNIHRTNRIYIVYPCVKDKSPLDSR